MKQTIKLNESQLTAIITETIKKVLREHVSRYYVDYFDVNIGRIQTLHSMPASNDIEAKQKANAAVKEGNIDNYVIKIYSFDTSSLIYDNQRKPFGDKIGQL